MQAGVGDVRCADRLAWERAVVESPRDGRGRHSGEVDVDDETRPGLDRLGCIEPRVVLQCRQLCAVEKVNIIFF